MSTFDGFVSEFPNIRIDYFRTLPDRPPPLACFLSHVHSDHLDGLESLKSPFIYCSPTTRELLLRLEKFPHRMNFSKGILECRKQTYKHLKTLVKPIPLETPTRIELSPGKDVQVTLLDANHCAGAVMFLIEGQGKAILYTGDIRSEEWWVNALIRQPKLVVYTTPLRKLDCIYLDTTFAVKLDPYRHFPSKATGLRELLEKLQKYPSTTIFYFQAWTFGYEDVWLALSQALNSPVHLDRYRYTLYTSVSRNNGPGLECREAPVLCGFKCGNTLQPGILTNDPEVRLHSCEKGTGCRVLDSATDVVTITPLISRHAGVEMPELGAGGGQGDLDQIHELDLSDPLAFGHLLHLCAEKIKDAAVLGRIKEMLLASLTVGKGGHLQLGLPEDEKSSLLDQDAVPLGQLPRLIAELALTYRDTEKDKVAKKQRLTSTTATSTSALPRSITFPYSRHSSYTELRLLVEALRPRAVWPCTVPPEHAWNEDISMESLLGDLCETEGKGFLFDIEMRARKEATRNRKRKAESQVHDSGSEDTDDGKESRADGLGSSEMEKGGTKSKSNDSKNVENEVVRRIVSEVEPSASAPGYDDADVASETESEHESPSQTFQTPVGVVTTNPPNGEGRGRRHGYSPMSPKERLYARKAAFEAAREGRWHEVGLTSVRRRGEEEDEEL